MIFLRTFYFMFFLLIIDFCLILFSLEGIVMCIHVYIYIDHIDLEVCVLLAFSKGTKNSDSLKKASYFTLIYPNFDSPIIYKSRN